MGFQLTARECDRSRLLVSFGSLVSLQSLSSISFQSLEERQAEKCLQLDMCSNCDPHNVQEPYPNATEL